ncbi:ERI1 exoribonuclease 2 isoform X2 [Echeneis naucrates]|uniref:ERI1 exoribonuclease 2 n=1 Tax=Echeneis naucrates TaxID=173247 RepID=A0A665T741_ECHNA|nr:ERI1 exoribonuclease 2 isoform X2 [Echeneis naucrates]
MATKKLARQLGLLRQRSASSSGTNRSWISDQAFSYLIVIDFESTCWREKNNYTQEIIEFPAVLLNTSSGEVESEFHTYVQPQEHPSLSEFCTELTGITQEQVEAGIPLQICLSRFSRWLQKLQLEKGVAFPNRQQRCSSPAPSPSQKPCTFLTWSDWDLGVCLQYECKRKQLHKPDVLNSWIDLRSTYRLFYNRKPKGLNGALQDLGIQFSGREHSGLDDARNTAQLAARMMKDGCVMKTTRSLEKTSSVIKPVVANTTGDNRKEKPNTKKEESMATSSSKNPPQSCQIKLCLENNTVNLVMKENSHSGQESVPICQSLISPKTLLNGTSAPLWGQSRRSVTSEAASNLSCPTILNNTSPHSNGNKSLVLCSTTLGRLSHHLQPKQLSETGAAADLIKDEQSADLLVEVEERCGSYDDVVLEGDGVADDAPRERDTEYISPFDSGWSVWEDTEDSQLKRSQLTLRDNISAENNSTSCDLSAPVFTKKIRTDQFNNTEQNSAISEADAYFAVPKAVTWCSRVNQHETGLERVQIREKADKVLKNLNTNAPSALRHNRFLPDKTSTPNISSARPKPVIMQNTKHKETLKSSFTIYTDSSEQAAVPLPISKKVLRPLTANTVPTCTDRSFTSVTAKPQKITSPLCACGRRAKRQVVTNGGPNHGRAFYCCPVRRSGSGATIQKGCEFFKWESALMKSSLVACPAAGSSVSLCQASSALNCRPQRSSTLRKSY